MSLFTVPAISIDSLDNLDDIKNYLRDLNKKVRYLSFNVDSDNFDPEEYKKFYKNSTDAVSLAYTVGDFTAEVKDYDTDITARIKQTAEDIALLVSDGDVTNQINISTDKIVISGNKLTVVSDNFNLDTSGNVSIKGTINALAGYFGNFQISGSSGSQYLYGNNDTVIDAADLSGTNIYTNQLDITTDNDISGCSINLQNCYVKSSESTYFGWFNCDDVTVSGTVMANCARVVSVLNITGTLYCYDIWSDQEGIAWSDRKLKKDIRTIDGKEALSFLMKLRPVMYKLIDDNSQEYGLIAQDVLAAGDIYHIVNQKDDGYYVIEYGALDAVIAAALQEQLREMEKTYVDI